MGIKLTNKQSIYKMRLKSKNFTLSCLYRDEPHNYGRDQGYIQVRRFYCRRSAALLYLTLLGMVAYALWRSLSG